MLLELFSILPIALLIILALTLGIKEAVWITLVATGVLFFVWGASLPSLGASVISAGLSTVQILMILFGAILFYQIMEKGGLIAKITASLKDLSKGWSSSLF